MKGFVSCIRRHSGSESDYFVVVSDGTARTRLLHSKLALNLGEIGSISMAEGNIEKFEALEGDDEKKEMDESIAKEAGGMRHGTLLLTTIAALDKVTEKMRGNLDKAADLLAHKLAVGAPIVVRFHNDIDGASGAYALHKAITLMRETSGSIDYKPNISWRMHGSVFYLREDATNDVLTCNNYECVERPLLVILDFGTGQESNPGVEIAKERFDVIWLDHHPIVEGFEGRKLDHYINPWNFGGDSNYTAGFLSCAFAKMLADVDTREIEEASFIGDYSEHSKPTVGSRKLAALLDLLTSDTRVIAGMRGNLTPDDIEGVIKDKAKSEELIAYAESRVAEMLDLAIESIKVYNTKETQIYVADFESIRTNDQERYPLPGRFASRLLGRIEELNKKPCIVMLHFGHFVSVRMSKMLIGRVDLLGTLESVRSDFSDYVDSAGGHSNAASIKLKGGEMKREIIKITVDRLKKEIEGVPRK